MRVYISHTTALWINVLAARNAASSKLLPVKSPSSLNDATASAHLVRRLLSDKLADTGIAKTKNDIDLMIPYARDRHHYSCTCPHQWTGSLPAGSFLALDSDVYVASPEFCFLLMAERRSVIELALLGYALCGGYFPACSRVGFVNTHPMTSTKKLRSYLDRFPAGTRGIAKARRALGWVIDGSLSPMESRCAMLITLGRHYGGYGVQPPQLNPRIELSPEARRLSRQSYCKVDLYWPEIRYGIEYNGAGFHEDIDHDSRREIALHAEGIVTTTITASQVLDQLQFREIIRTVTGRLGKRLRKPPADIAAYRHSLLAELFPQQQNGSNDTGFAKPDWALPSQLA